MSFFPTRPYPQGKRKLSDDDVRRIRQMARDGHSAPEVGEYYPGISIETLRKIIRRQTFREVPDLSGSSQIAHTQEEDQMALLRAAAAAHRRMQQDAGGDANELLREIETDTSTNPLDEGLKP